MQTIKIKALSVNKVWQGKRFKTQEYKIYEIIALNKLPTLEIPNGKLELELEFGFSNSGSDIDNCVKPFLDILQKKYKFNDSRIYRLSVIKTIIKKQEEFIKFKITKYICL